MVFFIIFSIIDISPQRGHVGVRICFITVQGSYLGRIGNPILSLLLFDLPLLAPIVNFKLRSLEKGRYFSYRM
jgi:hypothetical protein